MERCSRDQVQTHVGILAHIQEQIDSQVPNSSSRQVLELIEMSVIETLITIATQWKLGSEHLSIDMLEAIGLQWHFDADKNLVFEVQDKALYAKIAKATFSREVEIRHIA